MSTLYANGPRTYRTTDLPSITSWTVMWWNMIVVDQGDIRTFMKFGIPASNAYTIGLNGPSLGVAVRSPGSTTLIGTTLTVERWYHFAVVCEGTGANQLRFYLNGQLDVSQTGSASVTAGELVFGALGSSSSEEACHASFYGGKIWDVPLTMAEIQREYAQVCPVRTANLNTFSPWRMGADIETTVNYGGTHTVWSTTGTITTYPSPRVPWMLPKRSVVAAGTRTVVVQPAYMQWQAQTVLLLGGMRQVVVQPAYMQWQAQGLGMMGAPSYYPFRQYIWRRWRY